MATTLEIGRCDNGSTVATSTTRFGSTGDTWGMAGNSGQEGLFPVRRTAGSFASLYFRLSANTITNASTVTFRVASADKTQTMSIPGSTSGEFQDLIHSDAVTAGQLAAIKLVTGSTGTTMACAMTMVRFEDSTGNTTKRVSSNSSSGYPATTTLKFITLSGSSGGTQATESQAQSKIKTAGTLKNLFAHVSTNTLTKTTTIVSRINTANGAMTVSITTLSTGNFEDTSNTDTTSVGTLANYGISCAAAPSGAISVDLVSSEFTTTNVNTHCFAGTTQTGHTQGTSLTRYYALGGIPDQPSDAAIAATESLVQCPSPAPYTFSFLAINLQTNTVSAASTLTFRKNGGAVNQTVSITASTAGYFEDATNADVVQTGDEINMQLVTGGTGTALQMGAAGILATYQLLLPMWMGDQPTIIFDRIGVVPSGQI